jgi:hypothetical protein
VDASRPVTEILGLYIDFIDGSVSDAQYSQQGLLLLTCRRRAGITHRVKRRT